VCRARRPARAARRQAARIVQELDTEWAKLALQHFGGDMDCADSQARPSHLRPLCLFCCTSVVRQAVLQNGLIAIGLASVARA
jgi:hypothetical protein